jgi:nicotinate phosphoribosyltransferase
MRKSAGRRIKLVDMAARHCPGPEAVEMASYAAHVAGFDAHSSDLGAATFGGDGSGTMPHAWIGAFPSTVEAASAFAKAFDGNKITVLVDYYGMELSDSVECYKALGDRLEAVRIDTHGGRFCQGVTNTDADGEFAAITRLRNDFGVDFAGRYGNQYAYGRGVTVEAVYCLRRALDEAGAKNVKIVVSSGFTPEKVRAFVDMRAPVDVIGTGSFLPTDIRDSYATLDIVSYDGVKKIKVGRSWLLP